MADVMSGEPPSLVEVASSRNHAISAACSMNTHPFTRTGCLLQLVRM